MKDENTQYGFYFNAAKCSGCKTCHVSCKDRSDLSIGQNWRRVYEYEGGNWQELADGTFENNAFAYYMSVGCNHCNEPVCVKACPTGAMYKRREDGLVHIATELCIGCNSCAQACPYDAPQLDQNKKVMTKCDGCSDRLAEGKKPSCVESCPLRALDFDTMENLQARYGDGDGHIAPLPPESITSPNLIIKAHKDGQSTSNGLGSIVNHSEV
ncbi:dimethylsulfoxide reductase subunit B [Shewanella sp. D64]|uniref:DMSO/selenate family reductase complex B subunit n=1 Tax=unclassified Shewanella TaxID=196818 RepID=UPI0022BA5DAC|nr:MULTISPECIES: DMSO/selenate family reductase complex B subunit [unclassified Shewanella]MEC4728659.1 dimethylsulfoxide reductase subunit B [Shewanella sp. D64]MEC4740578.1 dimethylsulfoxide reductase subunit B [Shewanella sp. E94]WBJ95113.1 dimethylsulfoxide reductase subunit B [Shewanella sp. MTB7]